MYEQSQRAGRILYEARRKKGYSQQKLASMLGIHIRQYQRLEYAERPIENISMRLGLSVCKLLDLDPYDLIFPESNDGNP